MKKVLHIIFLFLSMYSAYANSNYMLMQLPAEGIDIYVDGAINRQPQFWCKPTVPLKIITTRGHSDGVAINNYITTAGMIAMQRCASMTKVSLLLVSSDGTFIRDGEATKIGGWRPVWFITPTPKYTFPTTPNQPTQAFKTVKECNMYNLWPSADQQTSLFVNDSEKLTCDDNGLLRGSTTQQIITSNEKTEQPIYFFQGYPLTNLPENINPDYINKFAVSYVNNHVLLISVPALTEQMAADYYSILQYNEQTRSWEFGENMLIVANKEESIENSSNINSSILSQTGEIYKMISNLESPPILLFTADINKWLEAQEQNTYQIATIPRTIN